MKSRRLLRCHLLRCRRIPFLFQLPYGIACIDKEPLKVGGLKHIPMIQTLPCPSIDHVAFLQGLAENAGIAEVFPPDFPHAIRQALALPLAEPGMLRADSMRSVYTLIAAGVEMAAIVHLMRLRRMWLLEIVDGELAAMPGIEVEPEDFDFDGNLRSD